MTDETRSEEIPSRGGDRRGEDRRRLDRRRVDRRTPLPPWRRPWAYVGYGVAGALALFLLLTALGEEEEPPLAGGVVRRGAPPAVDTTTRPAAAAPPRDAYGAGGFERLLAEGGAAIGQRVRTRLLCEPISPIALRIGPEIPTRPSVAALADASGRVPGAECTWGSADQAPEFLLLVPPELAERFAAAPEVQQGFIRRRRVHAEVEWIGRSEALALRNVGVLRAVLP